MSDNTQLTAAPGPFVTTGKSLIDLTGNDPAHPIDLTVDDLAGAPIDADLNRGGAMRRRPNRATPSTPYRPPRTQAGTRLSRFVFTLNNWTTEEYDDLTKQVAPTVKWMVIGRETSETGTPHLQGACIIGRQVSFSVLKTWAGLKRAHIERMNGAPHASLIYCSKEDSNPFIHGSLPQPGKRNDLHNAVERIRDGASIRDLANSEDATVVVKFHKGLTTLRSYMDVQPRPVPQVFWLHGPTGTGKTRSAVEFAESLSGAGNYWISSGSLRWFDGYDGHRVAIFDDLRPKHASFSFLLRLLDRYEVSVEFKGGFVRWKPEYIIVTANLGPREMWNYRTTEQLDQLERRCTLIQRVEEYPIHPPLPLPQSTNSSSSGEDGSQVLQSSL